ncbi:hypothetical protein [Luteolibacter sp. AS25]|uniref:hypothetical protein n=1 Tax=Luteolibacter sp. AS25 TaxID=3135776 RepID=UPI00398AF3F0
MNCLGEISGAGTAALLVLIPLGFTAVWGFVSLLVSTLFGWGRLGKRFRCIRRPEGQTFRMQGARLGMFGNYNGILTITVAAEGLYMAVFPAFRIGHPPILIPWSEIHDVKDAQMLWQKMTAFRVGRPEMLSISVSRKVGNVFPGR